MIKFVGISTIKDCVINRIVSRELNRVGGFFLFKLFEKGLIQTLIQVFRSPW